jgi:hypothetical protein
MARRYLRTNGGINRRRSARQSPHEAGIPHLVTEQAGSPGLRESALEDGHRNERAEERIVAGIGLVHSRENGVDDRTACGPPDPQAGDPAGSPLARPAFERPHGARSNRDHATATTPCSRNGFPGLFVYLVALGQRKHRVDLGITHRREASSVGDAGDLDTTTRQLE